MGQPLPLKGIGSPDASLALEDEKLIPVPAEPPSVRTRTIIGVVLAVGAVLLLLLYLVVAR